MKFFLDTVNIDDITSLLETGLIEGITTNPTLIAQSKRPQHEVIRAICALVPGPVSTEVIATDWKEILQEAHELARIAANVVIKVPVTFDGLKACYQLRQENIPVNVTLCFSPLQALLAARAGATYISPFMGRMDDYGQDGSTLLELIRDIYDNDPTIETQILAASVRSPKHVLEAAYAGADIVTLSPAVFRTLYAHPLTDKGLAQFLKDWKNAEAK
ncbi:MAG: fructose-6-phosphate aldolase [Holosporales bacterium]|jgi:transaldolase|nr:fructose-6-phosphate aldolase [Holosporales bacterium]